MNYNMQFFRAGAGAVIINDKGMILSFERSDIPGSWQMPQGGLDPGEKPLDAVLREVHEETGIPGHVLEMLARHPEPLAYELPGGARSPKTGLGQVIYWFLFRFNGPEEVIDIHPGGEFRNWKWVFPAILINEVVDFKKGVYSRILDKFNSYLAI